MDTQKILALALVLAAMTYLGRNLARSVRAALSGKGECGGGCGKCAVADLKRRGNLPSAASPDLISLQAIRPIPPRRRLGKVVTKRR